MDRILVIQREGEEAGGGRRELIGPLRRQANIAVRLAASRRRPGAAEGGLLLLHLRRPLLPGYLGGGICNQRTHQKRVRSIVFANGRKGEMAAAVVVAGWELTAADHVEGGKAGLGRDLVQVEVEGANNPRREQHGRAGWAHDRGTNQKKKKKTTTMRLPGPPRQFRGRT